MWIRRSGNMPSDLLASLDAFLILLQPSVLEYESDTGVEADLMISTGTSPKVTHAGCLAWKADGLDASLYPSASKGKMFYGKTINVLGTNLENFLVFLYDLCCRVILIPELVLLYGTNPTAFLFFVCLRHGTRVSWGGGGEIGERSALSPSDGDSS